MKYKYNSDLEIQHIALGNRLANYFGSTESLILVQDEDYKYDPKNGRCYVVASFDKKGYCNNASSYVNQDKAWDEFYRIMKEVRSENPTPENSDGDDSTDDE
jgi:hypothetical protein